MGLFKRPTVLYPTIVQGTIRGPFIRCESLTGPELLLPRADFPNEFRNFGPFQKGEHTYFVCHLQKAAYAFSLRYNPFIYHWCHGWKPQEFTRNPDGTITWKPGTEKLLYWRTPGWRWQMPDAVSDWTPWIFSGGRIIGTHLD